MVDFDAAVDEYDPMEDLKTIVWDGSKDSGGRPALAKIVVGAFPGNEPTPFAFLRSVGGPEPDAQDPEAQRRIDVTVFADTEADANRISNRIHRHIRRRHLESPDAEVKLPSIFSSGGPLDILDDDVKHPGVFRSYYVIYAEQDCA